MKKYLIIFIIIILGCYCTKVMCNDKSRYRLHLNPHSPSMSTDCNEQILFILDYSNSMNEMLLEKTKYEMLLESMKTILQTLSPHNKIGVRIYGQRWGFTPMDACRASCLVVPVGINHFSLIPSALSKYKPRGMTPITYSLKQAVQKDFRDCDGEKHIILITDGGENCDESPCTYAMDLIKYRKDIKIDVIVLNIDNDDDLEQLECTAKVTGGKLYNADTKAKLLNSLNNSLKRRKSVDAQILY